MLPNLNPLQYQTYRIASPLGTHRRKASCEEVGCSAWTYGWSSRFDTRDPNQALKVEYVRKGSGRAFREVDEGEGIIRFDFSPGQRCFASDSHTVPIRPESYSVVVGDYRLRSREVLRRHTRPVDWVEDMALHQDSVKNRIERG